MSSSSVSVIVPYRSGTPDRDAIAQWCFSRYVHLFPNAEILLSDAGGEIFSRGRSINVGVERSIGDTIVLLDADYLFDEVMARDLLSSTAAWTLGASSDHYAFITADSTQRVLAQAPAGDIDMGHVAFVTNTYVLYGGIISVPREHYVRFDEEMVGFGWEDNVWYWCMRAAYGEPHRTDNPFFHLHHERPASLPYMKMSYTNKDYAEAVWQPIKDDRDAMCALMRAKGMIS
jgi:hypothetical protein